MLSFFQLLNQNGRNQRNQFPRQLTNMHGILVVTMTEIMTVVHVAMMIETVIGEEVGLQAATLILTGTEVCILVHVLLLYLDNSVRT